MSYQFDEHVKQGWQCPICGAVYSPFMMACTNCTGYKVSNMTSATVVNDEIDRFMKKLSQSEWKPIDDGLKL